MENARHKVQRAGRLLYSISIHSKGPLVLQQPASLLGRRQLRLEL